MDSQVAHAEVTAEQGAVPEPASGPVAKTNDPIQKTDAGRDRRAERRDAMVPIAARLFADIGYAACEMERVAKELGVAKGTLYLYFASKEELFCACVDYGMRSMQSAVEAAATTTNDPFEKISRAIRAYLQFFADHPEHVELLIQERANFKHRPEPTYFQYRKALRGPWRTMYSDLMDQGRLRNDLPVERLLDTIGCLVYGTMFTNHFTASGATLDEQHRAILEMVMRGMLSDEQRTQWKFGAS